MPDNKKQNAIELIFARFGDLHEYSLEDLLSKSTNELIEISSRDSNESHR